jgi:endo-1,4-beta-xylanase
VAWRDAQTAAIAKSYLDQMFAIRSSTSCSAGLWDKHSWLNGFAPRADGLPSAPLLTSASPPSRCEPPSPTRCAPPHPKGIA